MFNASSAAPTRAGSGLIVGKRERHDFGSNKSGLRSSRIQRKRREKHRTAGPPSQSSPTAAPHFVQTVFKSLAYNSADVYSLR